MWSGATPTSSACSAPIAPAAPSPSRDEADADGWKSVWAKLGAPETPEGYELPVPQGQSTSSPSRPRRGSTRPACRRAGAAKLAGKVEQLRGGADAGRAAGRAGGPAAEHRALAKEWGQGPAAERSARSPPCCRQARPRRNRRSERSKTVGFSKVMKAFAKIGGERWASTRRSAWMPVAPSR